MRSLAISTLFVTLVLGTAPAPKDINVLSFKSAQDLKAYFHYTGPHVPIISGHRGGTTAGFPENCIATFENTLAHTPAIFEIDPRLTKDSVAVVMHDATLDRTTTGKGKLSDYTYAQLQQFKLKDNYGNVTGYNIPTLKELLIWSKGKTILNLDHKDVPLAMTARLIRESGNDMVMLTVHDAKQARFYVDDNARHMLSVFVLDKKSFDAIKQAKIPWENMIAYIGPTFTAQNKELLDSLHTKGVMCMISAAPSSDKLIDESERKKAYRDVFTQNADVLESDLPIDVADAIKGQMPVSGLQYKFWSKQKFK